MERNAGPAGRARFRRRGIVSWFLRAQKGCFSGAARRGRAFTFPFEKHQRRFRRREGTASVPGMLTPSRHCDSRAFHARQSRRILESGSLAPPPAALRRFSPFSFVLAKENVPRPVQKKTAFFIGLLVRPAKTGLVSSSCAGPLALPVRSRGICIAYAKSLVQIGLLCATAPLPLSRQKKRVYAPAEKKLATNARPSGSGARGTAGPLCTLKSAPNVTNAAQASWTRQTMSAAGNSQTGHHPMFS